ncbi:MAG: hypothetical protein BYD32DRAFT_419446 [Podila humilis]|nr:MAG: hypothetical protein BYD32DRAFT_419446 [Podila humilis]
MFLAWSFFALNAFFLLLGLLITLSFEATLAHVFRKVEGEAHSIRWIQQAGAWEMITAIFLSRGMKAKTPRRTLTTTLFISGALVAVPIAIRFFVKEARTEANPSQELVSSRQIIPVGTITGLTGWTFPVTYDTNVEEALTMVINSTMAIPRAVPTKRYRPKVSSYELVCDRFDIYAPNRKILVLPNDGCASIALLSLDIDVSSDLSRMYTAPRSNGRVKVVIPALAGKFHKNKPEAVQELLIAPRVQHDGEECLTLNAGVTIADADRARITSSPTIVLTRCQLKSGKSITISSSSIKFLSPSNEMFHSIATSIFGTQNELVLAMQDSANNSTLTTLPANEFEEVMVLEVKVTSNGVVALVCQWTRQSIAEVPHIACIYSISSVYITKPQPIDPNIAQRLVNKGLNPPWTNLTAAATLSYLPLASKDKVSFDIPKILDDSVAVARYFASIGNNFVVDWEGSMVYIFFDTVEIVKGYEIPLGLFISIVGVMVACCVYLVATEFTLDARYRESLYMTISRELLGGRDGARPRLHRFHPKTLEFEGQRRLIVPTSQPQSSEDVSVYPFQTPAGSQDPLTSL